MQVSKALKIHILGTDTDVGKTWICSKLVDFFNQDSEECLPIKPIHSGWEDYEQWGVDFLPHEKWLNNLSFEQLCRYRFKEPMSPHAASRLENETIVLEELVKFWENINELNKKVLFIEGVGGVCCPLSSNLTYLDFLAKVQGACILVSKIGLGSLNHAIMSDKLLKSVGLNVLGLVLNPEHSFDQDDLIYQHAKWELEQQTDSPVFGPLERHGNLKPLDSLMDNIKSLIQ